MVISTISAKNYFRLFHIIRDFYLLSGEKSVVESCGSFESVDRYKV